MNIIVFTLCAAALMFAGAVISGGWPHTNAPQQPHTPTAAPAEAPKPSTFDNDLAALLGYTPAHGKKEDDDEA